MKVKDIVEEVARLKKIVELNRFNTMFGSDVKTCQNLSDYLNKDLTDIVECERFHVCKEMSFVCACGKCVRAFDKYCNDCKKNLDLREKVLETIRKEKIFGTQFIVKGKSQ